MIANSGQADCGQQGVLPAQLVERGRIDNPVRAVQQDFGSQSRWLCPCTLQLAPRTIGTGRARLGATRCCRRLTASALYGLALAAAL